MALPTLELLSIVAVGVVAAVASIWTAIWIVGRATRRSDALRDEVVAHFDEQLTRLEARLPSADAGEPSMARLEGLEAALQDFQADFAGFAHQVGQDLAELPRRLEMKALSSQGVETRALQSYMDRTGAGELEELPETLGEAMATEDPDVLLQVALQKFMRKPLSDKYAEEHPVVAAGWDAFKVWMGSKMQEMYTGTGPARKALPKRTGQFPSVYGR